MYRENSVEHTPGQICMYRFRRVSICEKTVNGEKRFFYVFVLLVCELPLTEPPPEASSSVAREYMRPEARA